MPGLMRIGGSRTRREIGFKILGQRSRVSRRLLSGGIRIRLRDRKGIACRLGQLL